MRRIAGFPRVATSPEVDPRLETAKFGNCVVRSPVLSGSGCFVTRDESRQIAQKSRQSCRVDNVDDSPIKQYFFPTLATSLYPGNERQGEMGSGVAMNPEEPKVDLSVRNGRSTK